MYKIIDNLYYPPRKIVWSAEMISCDSIFYSMQWFKYNKRESSVHHTIKEVGRPFYHIIQHEKINRMSNKKRQMPSLIRKP